MSDSLDNIDISPAQGKSEKIEHFSGHGNNWEALGLRNEIRSVIETTISKGKGMSSVGAPLGETSPDIFPIIYPPTGAVRSCALIESTEQSDGGRDSRVGSCFPLLEGIANEVNISGTYTWGNKYEGEAEGYLSENKHISFFAPFYVMDFSYPDEVPICNVYLAGLAYSISLADDKPRTFSEGGFYEFALERFLASNPDKTKEDFPFATVTMEHTCFLFPKGIATAMEYMGFIKDIETVSFFDKKIIKIKFLFGRDADSGGIEKEYYMNLYASEEVLKDYTPKIGDHIQGVMWITGYLKDI